MLHNQCGAANWRTPDGYCYGNDSRSRSIASCLKQGFFDIRNDGLGLHLGRKPFDGPAIAVDEKLREVPLDAGRAEQSWLDLFQEGIERMCIGSVDIDLR